MIAKVYFSYIELDESDNEKFLTSEEELSPDSYGHWIDPNNQEYEAFLPISPEANNQFQSALPQVFKSASYSNERATSYNPFKQFISHEDLPIENSMLCIQSILSREMSVFILPKTAQPQCLGKHVLGFDIKVDDTESNLTSEAVLHFREYYSHKIYQESENESESPQNLNIKSTIQRIIKDSKNAGGHDMFAGGKLSLKGLTNGEIRQLENKISEDFAILLGQKNVNWNPIIDNNENKKID